MAKKEATFKTTNGIKDTKAKVDELVKKHHHKKHHNHKEAEEDAIVGDSLFDDEFYY